MKIKTKFENNSLNIYNSEVELCQSIKENEDSDDLFHKKMNNHSIEVMGYNVYSRKLGEMRFAPGKTVINTINAHSYVVARKDEEFQKALRSSDILIADGFPIVWAAKILNQQKIQKIAGEDIFYYLLNRLENVSGSCFFLGSSENTLMKIKQRLNREFTNINAQYYSPPYKDSFSTSDNQTMLKLIRTYKPDVLFVGMTAPKQEKWVYENNGNIEASIVCSIGAVFDFYARNIKRPSKFWVRLRLEWLIRLLKEPKRLWKRYLISSPRFLKEIIKFKYNK